VHRNTVVAQLRSAVVRRRRAIIATLSVAVVLAGGCGGGSGDSASKDRAPATTTTLPAYINLVAEVSVPQVAIYGAPNAPTPVTTLPNPWLLNGDAALPVQQVFLIIKHQGPWLQVLLPERPNGSTGWIHASDARITQNRYRITVELAAHRITVYDANNVLMQEAVAVGAPETPTPLGTYYTRVLLQAPDPTTVYGPFAYGLSGHSEVLTEFDGGDAEVGIHGNDDASVLGQSVTHGCVRMSNDGITKLSTILPLGTPVQIVA
jgi:lipoprotein-anchoring transpeptidase ErfK/SrfK